MLYEEVLPIAEVEVFTLSLEYESELVVEIPQRFVDWFVVT